MARAVEAPQRRCLVTREVKGQDQMIRFVLDPSGQVVPDLDGRLPGRGMWLSADRNVLNKAVGANLFARGGAGAGAGRGGSGRAGRAPARRSARSTAWAWRGGPARWPWASSRSVRTCARRRPAVLIAAADSSADGRQQAAPAGCGSARRSPPSPGPSWARPWGAKAWSTWPSRPGGWPSACCATSGVSPGSAPSVLAPPARGDDRLSDRAAEHDRTIMTDTKTTETKEQERNPRISLARPARPARADQDRGQRHGPAELLPWPQQVGRGRGQAQAAAEVAGRAAAGRPRPRRRAAPAGRGAARRAPRRRPARRPAATTARRRAAAWS